jgi:hypothetical protein
MDMKGTILRLNINNYEFYWAPYGNIRKKIKKGEKEGSFNSKP